MKLIRSPTLARAHELAVRYILEKGQYLKTENGEDTLETEEICICVDTPFAKPMISNCSRFKGDLFVREYTKNLLEGYSNSQFSYDYHSRLFHYSQYNIDQIDYIIQKLKTNPESRRALAITWNPQIDESMPDCPCLQLVQCAIRNGALDMKVVFRSNDMLSAAGSNMYALVHLQKYIADSAGVPVGKYTHIALIPHIYYRRDAADIPLFCNNGTDFLPVSEVCKICRRCKK